MSNQPPESPLSPAPKRTRGPSNAAKRATDEAAAVNLRRSGTSYRDIATALGFCNAGNAYRIVKRALDKARAQTKEDAEHVISLELLKLDRMEMAIAAQTEAKGGVNLAAVDRRLRICESRRKLLGLDGPVVHELTGPGGAPLNLAGLTDEELAIVKRLLAPPA